MSHPISSVAYIINCIFKRELCGIRLPLRQHVCVQTVYLNHFDWYFYISTEWKWCFSMSKSISILFTGHVLWHDKKYIVIYTQQLQTLLQFFAKGSNQWVMHFRFFSYLIIKNCLTFCPSICPFKGGSTLFHEKYSFLTRSKILRGITIVCGVSQTFSNLLSLLMCIYFHLWDW